MSKFTPPTSGGSFVRQESGGLKQVEKPAQNPPLQQPAPTKKPAKAKEA